jgi:hypothetical protein
MLIPPAYDRQAYVDRRYAKNAYARSLYWKEAIDAMANGDFRVGDPTWHANLTTRHSAKVESAPSMYELNLLFGNGQV